MAELKKMHLFKVGTWPGENASDIEFTTQDLDEIIASFSALDLSGRVPLVVGHDNALGDSAPAYGWIERLWRVGGNLYADAVDVPQVLFKAIASGAYKHVSIELLKNAATQAGKRFKWVLDRVAVLGSAIPAVDGLESLQKLALRRDSLTFSGAPLSFKRSLRFAPPPPIDDPETEPEPREDENEQGWMGRCMVSSHMNTQNAEQGARAVACYRIWQKSGPMAHGGGGGSPPGPDGKTAKLSRAAKPAGDYGDAATAGYADEGWQKDGKPRFPLKENGKLSESRIRAAWNYAAHPSIADKYSSADLAKLKAAIVRAWRAAIDESGPPSAAVKHSRTDDPEFEHLVAENARLEAEHASFAKAQSEAAAKAHREALIADLEAAVRSKRILPATRERFAKQLADPNASLRFSREDVSLYVERNDESSLLKRLCSGISGLARDPREGGLHGQVRFELQDVTKRCFSRSKAEHLDPFEALYAELRADPDLASQVWADTFSPRSDS